jgi:hypothetical protein
MQAIRWAVSHDDDLFVSIDDDGNILLTKDDSEISVNGNAESLVRAIMAAIESCGFEMPDLGAFGYRAASDDEATP